VWTAAVCDCSPYVQRSDTRCTLALLFAGRVGGDNRWQQETAAVSRGGRCDSFGTALTILAETFPSCRFYTAALNMAGLGRLSH
jgi:hypothetical protein